METAVSERGKGARPSGRSRSSASSWATGRSRIATLPRSEASKPAPPGTPGKVSTGTDYSPVRFKYIEFRALTTQAYIVAMAVARSRKGESAVAGDVRR